MGNTNPIDAILNQAPPPTAIPPPTADNPIDAILRAAPTPAPAATTAASSVNPIDAILQGGTSTEAITQPKVEPQGFANQAWSYLNTPLVDLTRQGAGPIETGVENFVSGFTSPASLGLLAASFGGSAVEEGLAKLGWSATDAAAATLKAKLAGNALFLGKYGYDLGTQTIPQFNMALQDYRSATNDRDKQKALDKLEEQGTESVLNALTVGMATKGIATDISELQTRSPKGQALAQEQYADALIGSEEKGLGYQGMNQVGNKQAKDLWRQAQQDVPDDFRRRAIGVNIEAGGNPDVMERWAKTAESDPKLEKYVKVYRAAQDLSDSEKEARDGLIRQLEADGKYLVHIHALPEDAIKDNYLPHRAIFEDVDPETGKVTKNAPNQGEDMLKKRAFDSMAEGRQNGVEYATDDPFRLGANYHEQVMNLISRREFAQNLASARMNDGLGMSAPGHKFPGYVRGVDAPLNDVEVENLKKTGQLKELLRTGRVYTRPIEPEEPEPGTQALATIPKNVLPGEAPQQAQRIGGEPEPENVQYMYKQRDFVKAPGLEVLRPVSATEVNALPKDTQIIPFGQGPFPEQAIMEPGMAGIPGVQPEPPVGYVKQDLMVRPEIAHHLLPTLERTTPTNALVREILKASSEAKESLLALSPFHWATMLYRTLESGMNPFGEGHNLARYLSGVAQDAGKLKKPIFVPDGVDPYNLTPKQEFGLRTGVTMGEATRPGFGGYLEEGVGSGDDSFINRIPLIGGLNKAISQRLFGGDGWITSLKFDLHDKLTDELLKSKPSLTREQAGRIAAAQVNNKFGGLNYTILGRGANTQNALRAMLLAPDFLESTGRSVLDVAGSNGGRLLKTLVAFNAAHWLFSRGLNYLVSGDTHPEAGFSVLSKNGKREYNVRTTLGDFLHFAENWKDFMANRVNPLLLRAPAELAEGEDQLGNKVTGAQEFWDTLKQIIPIPAQGLLPTQQITQPSESDQLLQAAGVRARKNYSPAETLANQLSSRGDEGGPLEGDALAKAQLRYKLEDQLRTAINAKDNEARMQAVNQIHQASSGPDAKLSGEEASKLIQQANKFPSHLQATVTRLPLEDALQVWDKAGLTEQRILRPIIQKKIETWQMGAAKRTRKDNDTMRQRIQAFRYSLGG